MYQKRYIVNGIVMAGNGAVMLSRAPCGQLYRGNRFGCKNFVPGHKKPIKSFAVHAFGRQPLFAATLTMTPMHARLIKPTTISRCGLWGSNPSAQ